MVVQHRDNTRVADHAWGALEFGFYIIFNPPNKINLGTRAPTNQGQASGPAKLPCALKPTKPMRKKVTFLNSCKWNKLKLNKLCLSALCWSPCTIYDFFNIPYYSESCKAITCLRYNSFLTTLVIPISVCYYAGLRNAITI